MNIWTGDGFKDVPADRKGPRDRYRASIDEILSEPYDFNLVKPCIESKVFGIGVEAYTVGSAEFALTYAAYNRDKCIPLMDNGHYHPTEVVSDKIPALLAFFPEIALHVTRPIRWDSDHVVLLDDETKAFADANVGFADCAVDRIVPKMDFADPLDVAVEEFSEWDVERSGWKGELPEIDGMSVVDDLSAYIERKLFTLNSGHAICAYLGCLRGHHTILDSVSDPVIGPIVYRAMQQSGAGLVKKFSMDAEKHQAYIDRIFARFHNPYLQDEVARVGREPIRKLAASDRLISPLLTAYNFGLPVDQLIFGAAAALRYDNAEDPQSVELQKTIAEQGAAAALEQYSGLAADHPLSTRILDVYRALAV